MTCKTEITKVDADWVNVKNECRNTVNKEATDNVPGSKFKKDLLISEHSPIRLIRIQWRWAKIKSWIATHFARHWLGWDKWIGTRRTDRTGVDRDELRQDELVPMDISANAQALINVSRFRLCRQAATETREYMAALKTQINTVEPEVAYVMTPNCIYRCGCPEFHECGYWQAFKAKHPDIDLSDIRARYDAYNQDFFGEDHAA